MNMKITGNGTSGATFSAVAQGFPLPMTEAPLSPWVYQKVFWIGAAFQCVRTLCSDVCDNCLAFSEVRKEAHSV